MNERVGSIRITSITRRTPSTVFATKTRDRVKMTGSIGTNASLRLELHYFGMGKGSLFLGLQDIHMYSGCYLWGSPVMPNMGEMATWKTGPFCMISVCVGTVIMVLRNKNEGYLDLSSLGQWAPEPKNWLSFLLTPTGRERSSMA
ncbi:hypothetical protein V2G26_006186 [Clonostachys chloroleuca]